jgi:hypothetical protein
MHISNPPKFLILVTLAIFFFFLAAGVVWYWEMSPASPARLLESR